MTASWRPAASERMDDGDADNRKYATHDHVLEVGDGERSPRIKEINPKVYLRDVPVR
jgi:hypothetical protein